MASLMKTLWLSEALSLAICLTVSGITAAWKYLHMNVYVGLPVVASRAEMPSEMSGPWLNCEQHASQEVVCIVSSMFDELCVASSSAMAPLMQLSSPRAVAVPSHNRIQGSWVCIVFA
jgi:hypothetical protein